MVLASKRTITPDIDGDRNPLDTCPNVIAQCIDAPLNTVNQLAHNARGCHHLEAKRLHSHSP